MSGTARDEAELYYDGEYSAWNSPFGFFELLQQLADAHVKEVQMLQESLGNYRAEVDRLRSGSPHKMYHAQHTYHSMNRPRSSSSSGSHGRQPEDRGTPSLCLATVDEGSAAAAAAAVVPCSPQAKSTLRNPRSWFQIGGQRKSQSTTAESPASKNHSKDQSQLESIAAAAVAETLESSREGAPSPEHGTQTRPKGLSNYLPSFRSMSRNSGNSNEQQQQQQAVDVDLEFDGDCDDYESDFQLSSSKNSHQERTRMLEKISTARRHIASKALPHRQPVCAPTPRSTDAAGSSATPNLDGEGGLLEYAGGVRSLTRRGLGLHADAPTPSSDIGKGQHTRDDISVQSTSTGASSRPASRPVSSNGGSRMGSSTGPGLRASGIVCATARLPGGGASL